MTSFDEIKAEEAMLNARLREFNKQRAAYCRVMHAIQIIPRAHCTAEQKRLFREHEALRKALDMQMRPMQQRYREIQELYPYIKQVHRLRL